MPEHNTTGSKARRDPASSPPQIFDDLVGYLRFDRLTRTWRPGAEAGDARPAAEHRIAGSHLRCA